MIEPRVFLARLASASVCLFATFALNAQEAASVASETAAQEESEAEPGATRLDEVVVTGSRIARIAIEGPLPISVIERETLLHAGVPSLSDALRDLPWNSFGSFGETPNSDAPNVSLPRLRGLGSKYTLTLVDGQRLPGFAGHQGGAAASVTGLPLIAVDRIEVLRDGASAIYGSDAIGGVINLITRRGDMPPEFEMQWDFPEQAGGDAWRAAFATSGSGTRHRWLLALEALDRQPLLGRQRDYFLENAATSPSGNPGSYRRINPSTGDFVGPFTPDARCPDAFDSDPVFPSSRVQAQGANRLCVYRFRDLNMERAAYEARSLWFSGAVDLDDSLSLFARGLGVDGQGRTQLAPAPAGLLRIAANNPFNPTLGELGPGLGYPLVLNYRLTALGPRVTDVDERSWHLLGGIEGALDWNEGGNWQLALFRNRYDSIADRSAGFALRSRFQAALTSARFNPFQALPGDTAGLEDALVRPITGGLTRASGLELAFSVDTAGPWELAPSHAFGIDLRRDQFDLEADAASRAGDVIGQGLAMPPEGAARNYAALFGETFVTLGSRWELSLAARYDRYQDAGGRTSPKVALAFRPAEAWLLRGSLGAGFQAPDLVSAYGGFASGADFAVDPTECAARPDDPIACEVRPMEFDILPNPALAPERARQGQLGLIWQPHPDFDLSLDYVCSHLRDQIDVLGLNEALQAEFDCARSGASCDPARDGRVLRDEFGNVARVELPWVNLASTRSEALDLEGGWRRDSRWGKFGLRLRLSRALSQERQRLAGSPRQQGVDAYGAPSWRGDLSLDWERGAFGATLGLQHIDGYAECPVASLDGGPRLPDCATRISSHSETSLQLRWRSSWGGEFALGARDLLNRGPTFDRFGNFAYGLYDPDGRVVTLGYRHAFGAE
jgi:iron complex outermembrane receptor protein